MAIRYDGLGDLVEDGAGDSRCYNDNSDTPLRIRASNILSLVALAGLTIGAVVYNNQPLREKVSDAVSKAYNRIVEPNSSEMIVSNSK